jgi:ParB family chromosome partitioning protein
MTAQNLSVETVDIDSLTLDPNNARRHPTKNLEAIASSLEKFGQRRPLVVWQNTIIAGNGTMVAAKSIGWREISITRVPDEWAEAEAKAFALADNRTAELADWDPDMLAATLSELDEAGFEIQAIGFEPLSLPAGEDWADAFQAASRDREPIQQMSFTFHDDQVETVKEAIRAAKALGDFGDTGNPNNNGNAIARICELFLGTQV